MRNQIFKTADAVRTNVALKAAGQSYTYEELLGAAGSLLAAVNSGLPGLKVAILASRKAAYYAGVFSAIVNGWTYIPLNLKWPTERLGDICSRAKPDILLLDETAMCADWTRITAIDTPVWLLESSNLNSPKLLREGSLSWRHEIADDLLYIMFTSGSTGEPKGVPILSSSVHHYATQMSKICDFTEEDSFIQNVELTFDLSVHDMMLCWSCGGRLISVPEQAAPLAPRFVQKESVTSWLSVPSSAAQSKTLGLLQNGCMPSLRNTFFCGEALPDSLANTWAEAAPKSKLFNIYGPTEATIACSVYEWSSQRKARLDPVPLGVPLGQQAMKLSNEGEILLAGPQLSPGYLDDPAKTAERFFLDQNIRWYRTGDLGGLDADGGFLFRGRLDSQIKLRGYRVELGDIESALRRVSGTDLVAVVPVDQVAVGSYNDVAAFVSGTRLTSEEIQKALQAILPPYMLPKRVLDIQDMPKNTNDKIDKLALCAMLRESL